MGFRFLSLTKTDFFRLLSAFLLGMILGALTLNLVTAQYIDDLIYENKELNNRIKSKDNELKKLEESLTNRKWRVVQRIKILVETEENKHVKQELELEIYELLKSIIGRQMSKVDGTLISNTIDDRIIVIEDENYQINLIWLLLQEETVVKIKAIHS
ncbi:hypothetical protein [Selenihalanaerobacter shriftii]|uniref:Sporulation membrane protein YtrI C-terminal domain-containing protein n=1 Tax=Selenihalanaerobacter shriftii TaxID=142842 RepID=A0A1T4JQ61_9FIRM|nr:hypothetical protein [Selenihalanaerobacter shriftii]SJZ32215.1 hypothetical protein SAMN02745118_00296 [Selenihalanaerobacter shriftii]